MDDNARFRAWFVPWYEARPDTTPLGWFTATDLQAAWNASRADAFDALIEDLHRKPKD